MSIWDTMARQHGVASLRQFEDAGISASTVRQWTAAKKLVRVHRFVYAVAASPDTFHRKCWAALLAAPGSALSHRTAAFLWGLYHTEPPIEIVVPRGRTPDLRGVVVHQTRDPYVRHQRQGLWVTSPLRTVVDLGAVEPPAVWNAVDRGRVANLFTIAALEWQMVEVARHGRRGVGALRRVLDEWALGNDRPDGMLEPRFARLRVRYGLPAPVFQYAVGPYRIDFAYPEYLIAVEVDGYAFHSGLEAHQRDRDRQNYLVALGWTVLRFTWADVVRRPGHVATVLLTAIGRASDGISSQPRPIYEDGGEDGDGDDTGAVAVPV